MPGLKTTLTLAAVGFAAVATDAEAQDWTQREFPLAPPNASGNFVAPYFDGFYKNEDGTYTLSVRIHEPERRRPHRNRVGGRQLHRAGPSSMGVNPRPSRS